MCGHPVAVTEGAKSETVFSMRIVRQIMADRTSGSLSVALLAFLMALQGLFGGFAASVAQAQTHDPAFTICVEHGSTVAIQSELPDPVHQQKSCPCGLLCAAMAHGFALVASSQGAEPSAQRVLYAGNFSNGLSRVIPSTLHLLRDARGPPAPVRSSLPA